MGMFDTIVVAGLKLKAPKEVTNFLKANNAEFPKEYQTKDLDCSLSNYKINAEGVVYYEERKFTGKKIPCISPFSCWQDKRSWLERTYWKFKFKDLKQSSLKNQVTEEVKNIWNKCKITNTLTMLSYDEIGGRNLTLDYEVKIVEGKVKSTKLLRWEIESQAAASKRHKTDAEFKAKIDTSIIQRRAFQSKWYYPILKETVNPFIFFSKIIIQKICNKIINWTYRWYGV